MKSTPVGWPRISSCVYYEDPHKAIDWLCRAFDFKLRLKVEGEAGEVVHSELTYGEGVVMVGSQKPEHGWMKSPRMLDGANTQSLMVYVDDIEAHHARAVAGGATITQPIELHDYGEEYWADRSYGANDHEGHHWWFCQRMRDKGKPTP